MEINKEDHRYFKAKKKVEAIKSFYTNVIMYIFFICALAGLNYYVNGLRHPWFLWAAFGWGLGLLFQAIKVFNWPLMGKNWEDKKIREYMEEDKQDGNPSRY